MARGPRVEFEGALYHVIARGNRREEIFHSGKDYERYLSKLGEIKERYSFYLFSFCLMPNHIHLLIKTNLCPLSHIMRIAQTAYACYYNKKYKKVGHVFQGRYKAILCDADNYLLELIRYIHLNPVRAGISDAPHTYPFCSHKDYMQSKGQTIIDKELILPLFSKSGSKARRSFDEFVLERLEEKKRQDFYRVADQRFLGDEGFVEDMVQKLDDADNPKLKRISKVDLRDVLTLVVAHFGLDEQAILNKTQSRTITLPRNVFIYIAKQRFGFSSKEIACFLEKDGSAVSHVVRRMQDRLLTDGELKLAVDRLFNQLT